MKRKIRLTESELVNLIERIVIEVKNDKKRKIMESRGKRRRMNESRNRKPSLNSLKRRNRRRK